MCCDPRILAELVETRSQPEQAAGVVSAQIDGHHLTEDESAIVAYDHVAIEALEEVSFWKMWKERRSPKKWRKCRRGKR